MTIANNYAPVVVAANSSTTVFTGSWNALSASYFKVSLLNTTTGVSTPVTQGVGANQYQVTTLTTTGWVITFNTAPTTGNNVVIARDTTQQQSQPYTTSRGFQGSVEEGSFDTLTAICQELQYQLDSAITVPTGDTPESLVLPIASLRATYVLAFDASGNVIVSTQTLAQMEAGSTSAAASAAAAAASASSASSSASSASASATSATSSAASAASSATAAAAAAGSVLWNKITFLTVSNSPYTVLSTDEGTLFAVNSSGGNVVINLPSIASEILPFNIGVKKESSDGNTITINANGTDTIDGAPSATISTPGSGTTFIAENTTTPKEWISASFGASAGNLTPNTFSGNGSTTTFTLSVAPGSANNVWVYISGVRQVPTTDYTVSGSTITFTTAPPTGTNNIFCLSGTTLSIGTPAAGTVTTSSLAGALVLANGSTATTQSNTDSSSNLATTAFANPGQSLSGNGYVKLPGGVIIQWGTFTTSSSGYSNITMPIAWPNGIKSMIANINSSTNAVNVIDISLSTSTATQTPVAAYTTGGSAAAMTISWIAIGY